MCVCVSNLHNGDVSVQNSEGEGCPVSTIRMHRGVLWGAWWDLAAQDKSALHTNIKVILSRKHKYYVHHSLCELRCFKADACTVGKCRTSHDVQHLNKCVHMLKLLEHIYRHVKVGPGIDQHLD